jgi:hypothetical protein
MFIELCGSTVGSDYVACDPEDYVVLAPTLAGRINTYIHARTHAYTHTHPRAHACENYPENT